MLLVIRKQDNFYNKNKMKMYLLILCIMVALFYNSLGVCGKPTKTNYIHSISKDKYNLVLSFIKFEEKRDIPVTPTEVGFSLSLSLYLSLVGGALVYDITVIAVFKSRILGFQSRSAQCSVFQTFCVDGKM